VAFVGRGATFQIWNPKLFEEHQEEARQRVQEKQATLKLRGSDES
jgi:MraZ protein